LGLWRFGAFVTTTDLIARIALLSALTVSRPALPILIALACIGSITTEIRLAIGRELGTRDGDGFRLAQHLLTWTVLPIPIFHAAVIWGGFVTSPVQWAHVRYVVDKAGQVV